jgi:hypothetical protein
MLIYEINEKRNSSVRQGLALSALISLKLGEDQNKHDEIMAQYSKFEWRIQQNIDTLAVTVLMLWYDITLINGHARYQRSEDDELEMLCTSVYKKHYSQAHNKSKSTKGKKFKPKYKRNAKNKTTYNAGRELGNFIVKQITHGQPVCKSVYYNTLHGDLSMECISILDKCCPQILAYLSDS